ncbi:riboflavin synthase [uncultured Desulfovibrio sp.]|uniref:riboflavin synthase n=1 Tax=uncultured Desulfovibrio sp. TaxID=167968 RepID=UPI00260AF3ED|nr:riboflavin synthase [uncultured Desulfovibrio sp.]
MFTGIIQGQGEVLALRDTGTERRFTLRPLFNLNSIVDGESIAVNGACLSVESHGEGVFTAYASTETLSRTTLGRLKTGDSVNMERALALGDRLGGHLVSGHVDCLATVRSVTGAGQSLCCRLAFPKEYGVEVIAKGSVALDGISLTINDCGPDFLEVNIIPDTQKRTTMRNWRPGTLVNMETDLIGKYVRSLLGAWAPGGKSAAEHTAATQTSGLSREMLLRNGFI